MLVHIYEQHNRTFRNTLSLSILNKTITHVYIKTLLQSYTIIESVCASVLATL